MALTVVYSDYIDKENYNYNSFDGTTLPPLSGDDLISGYMSYYSRSSDNIDRCYAIKQFINKNISTLDKQKDFLKEFIIILDNLVKNNTYQDEENDTYNTLCSSIYEDNSLLGEDIYQKKKED
jgi:hypothetical protein